MSLIFLLSFLLHWFRNQAQPAPIHGVVHCLAEWLSRVPLQNHHVCRTRRSTASCGRREVIQRCLCQHVDPCCAFLSGFLQSPIILIDAGTPEVALMNNIFVPSLPHYALTRHVMHEIRWPCVNWLVSLFFFFQHMPTFLLHGAHLLLHWPGAHSW